MTEPCKFPLRGSDRIEFWFHCCSNGGASLRESPIRTCVDHNAKPRLNPASPDVLAVGMAFNAEPDIYVESYGGVRQCNKVAVTEGGAGNLTAS